MSASQQSIPDHPIYSSTPGSGCTSEQLSVRLSFLLERAGQQINVAGAGGGGTGSATWQLAAQSSPSSPRPRVLSAHNVGWQRVGSGDAVSPRPSTRYCGGQPSATAAVGSHVQDCCPIQMPAVSATEALTWRDIL